MVAAVIERAGEVLACRRSPDRVDGGKWEFPGGKVEPGESDQVALEREIREELGVSVAVGELLDATVTVVGDRSIELRCYGCSFEDTGPVESTDHDLVVWVRVDALAAFDWAEADRPMVQALAGTM